MGIAKAYARELREQTNYSATWLPHVPVAVGDVGTLHKNEWTRQTTLADLGIEFEVDEGSSADYTYASKNAVKVSGGTSGQSSGATTPVGKAEGKLHMEFTREGAVVFETAGTRSRRMKDIHSVGRMIVERFHDGNWEKDYVVVTEVLAVASAVILVASGKGAAVDLEGNADVAPSLGSLAKLGADLNLASAQNLSVKIVGNEPLTPLFKAFRVKERWFGNTEFATRSIAVGDAPELLVRADYDDFDDD